MVYIPTKCYAKYFQVMEVENRLRISGRSSYFPRAFTRERGMRNNVTARLGSLLLLVLESLRVGHLGMALGLNLEEGR